MVDVGSCTEDESRVEVVKVEYIRSPMAALASHLIACYAEVYDIFVEGRIAVAHLLLSSPEVWGCRHGAAECLKTRGA